MNLSPYNRFAAIFPHDTIANPDLAATPPEAIYVGGAGSVRAVMSTGGTVDFLAVPAGTILPIAVVRVNSTGTTATGLVALYTV